METIEGVAGKVDGFFTWRDMVLATVDHMGNEIERCDGLAQNNPPNAADRIRITTCKINARATFGADMVQLGNLFVELGLGSVELSIWFVNEMIKCFA